MLNNEWGAVGDRASSVAKDGNGHDGGTPQSLNQQLDEEIS